MWLIYFFPLREIRTCNDRISATRVWDAKEFLYAMKELILGLQHLNSRVLCFGRSRFFRDARPCQEVAEKSVFYGESAVTLTLWPLTTLIGGRTAPLTSKGCILYIYSTNIGTEYFKHGIYSPFLFFIFKMQFVS